MNVNCEVKKIKLDYKLCDCPVCGTSSKRIVGKKRRVKDIGIERPVVIDILYSSHFCPNCNKHFSYPMNHIADLASRVTNRVRYIALGLLKEMSLIKVSEKMKEEFYIDIPPTTLHDWRKRYQNDNNS